MEIQDKPQTNKTYLFIVVILMFVLPCLCVVIEVLSNEQHLPLMNLAGKWFLFWSVGVRLLTAGLRQAINPSFTARDIFHLENKESFVIVKELGFANICLGSIGVISLFIPSWRIASAFAGGLYLGIAGVNHIIKKPAGSNEWIAMISDIFMAFVMMVYILLSVNFNQ